MSAAARRRRTHAVWLRRWRQVAGALGALVLAAACSRSPAERMPPGTLWAGDAVQTVRLLQGLEQLQGTPAALVAADFRRRLTGCRRFLAFCPAGRRCTLATTVRCEPEGELASLADEARGEAGWVFLERTPVRRLSAWGNTREDGGVAVHAKLQVDPADQLWQALLPARRAAGLPVLTDDDALFHLRLRSDQGAASLGKLGDGKWAEELFGLREKAFLAMDLEGTIELAVFEPAAGELIPPLALAIHVRRQQTAAEAMEKLIAGVRTRWRVSRQAWRFGNAPGACLDDLNVLPDLAPCYVATERALVLGWNRRSVSRALAKKAAGSSAEASELIVALDRFPAADERLRAAYRSAGGPVSRYAWSRAALTGLRRWGTYELDLELRAAPPAPGGAP